MSDLGRLFRLKSNPAQEPLENFTTVALAIAIGHDDRPMRHALGAVKMPIEDAPPASQGDKPFPPLAPFGIRSEDIAEISAETQLTVFPRNGTGFGYLDLVLHLVDNHQTPVTVWVEVKVDSGVNGAQLRTYAEHAHHTQQAVPRPSWPVIITLGRTRIVPYIPSLTWSDIADAVRSVADPHNSWLVLLEFLVDEYIVRPPLPPVPDRDAHMQVLLDVNRHIAALWPQPEGVLFWANPWQLQQNADGWFAKSGKLVTTGGPLRYGLVPVGDRWEWSLAVRTDTFQKVFVDPDVALRDASLGQLPSDWMRSTADKVVLERRIPLEHLTSHDDVVAWFDDGCRQLDNARILDPFLLALGHRRDHG